MFTLLLIFLLVVSIKIVPSYRAVRQVPSPHAPKPAEPKGRKADDWKHSKNYNWETSSYFNPVSQDITNASAERLCESYPDHLLSLMVQPVLKLGHEENKARVEAQLSSVSACIKDLLIFSDLEETIRGHQVYDILADLPATYRINNPDFSHYTYMQELHAKGELDNHTEGTKKLSIDGWAMDKYKFFPSK
jgi:hypothetical protein